MTTEKFEVVIWYETAQKPEDKHKGPLNGYVEKERFDNIDEVKDFIKDQIWQVDNLEESGQELPDGRKEYGYWSKTKDRQTGKQWYEWATVEVRKMELETVDVSEVLN